jgi:cyclic beta-1,2-glucan synthetase
LTWDTGSASWMHRAALEGILGFHQRGERLFIKPCIPASWKEFTIEYRYKSSTYVITVENQDGLQCGAAELSVDGRSVDAAIPLVDDGKRHEVTASLRASPSIQEKPAKARL